MTFALTMEAAIESAATATGLDDLGDGEYRDGLAMLLQSLDEDVELFDPVAMMIQGTLIQVLMNRLQVTQLFAETPALHEEEIERPIFITGLPRTGTTLLHTLLALDPASRYLRNWETAAAICPPPELLRSATDERIQQYHQAMQGVFDVAPQLRAINGINFLAGGTAECQNLLAMSFRNFGWAAGYGLERYGRWLTDCELAPAYRWHRRLLQLLQWREPGERWVGKAPMHLLGLDALLATYPDAVVVQTHRDPLTALASGASMVYGWSSIVHQRPHRETIGSWWADIWAVGLQRGLEARARHPRTRFVDVHLRDLVDDPVVAVKRLYERCEIPLSVGHERRMRVWLRDNPPSRFGSHSYSLAPFGLDVDDQRFTDYVERFGVNRESD